MQVILYLRLIRECVLLPEAPLPLDPVPQDETDLAVSSLCSRNGGSTMDCVAVSSAQLANWHASIARYHPLPSMLVLT